MNQLPGEGIRDFLRDREDHMVEFLRKLVLAESPSSEPDAQPAILHILLESLQELGFEVRIIPGKNTGGHLIANRIPLTGSATEQLLLGHCDTVWPIGTLKHMPFTFRDGKVTGPGVFDMKGGLTQMIFALRALRELELEPTVTPIIFVNSDEEIGSPESKTHIEDLAKRVERVYVLEPALGLSGRLKTARKGVGRFNVLASGRAAHAGLDPERGISAVLELSYVIQKLFALNAPERGVSVNVGVIEGGLRPNVVAPASKAEVDVRVPDEREAQRIEKAIRGLRPETPGVTLTIEGGMNRPPLERTASNRALWKMARDSGARMKLELEQGMAGGGSDGNITSQFAATIDGLGAVGDGAHANHEFIFVPKMVERATLLALLINAPTLSGT